MKKRVFIFIFACMAMAHCGGGGRATGGAEAGNPPTGFRYVEGDVSDANVQAQGSALMKAAIEDCFADQIIATNSQGTSTTATVDDNCGFTLTLAINKSYAVSLVSDGAFVATMIFTNNPNTLPTSIMVLSNGASAVNLGRIFINLSNNQASPEFEPSSQCDSDDDGEDDFDDEDDDNDGTSDDDEEDCDLDGYFDDHDDDSECEDDEDEEDASGDVLEVSPRDGEDNVDVDEKIVARFDCTLDELTVTNASFAVTDEADQAIDCDFDFEEDQTEVQCDYDGSLTPLTVYTATINGILCEDGTPVENIEWSWTTDDDN
ncbi:MAG TPA: hypothetical protein DDW49_02540 [Deltaproteobacteria bacterium]|nr:hypothetical protein [Deltaproteobacteria bacterium]